MRPPSARPTSARRGPTRRSGSTRACPAPWRGSATREACASSRSRRISCSPAIVPSSGKATRLARWGSTDAPSSPARRRSSRPAPARRSHASPWSWAAATGPGPPRRSRWRGPCGAARPCGSSPTSTARRWTRSRWPTPSFASSSVRPPGSSTSAAPSGSAATTSACASPAGSASRTAGIVAGRQADHAGKDRRAADVSLDSGRARRELGWEPRPIDEAIRESRAARGPG